MLVLGLCERPSGLREAGLVVELLETRHVKTALSTIPVKTDGALQVDGRTGSARPTSGAQAGAIEAVRHRDEPARHSAGLRA